MTGNILIKKSPRLAIEVPATFTAAPCRGDNEVLFYSYARDVDTDMRAYRRRATKARTICGTCPIARACAHQARTLPRSAQFGIWAGRDLHLHPYESFMERRTRERGQFLT